MFRLRTISAVTSSSLIFLLVGMVLLAGWAAYFSYGTRFPAYRAVDNHVYERVRNFLARRHKVKGRGVGQFPRERVHGELGVLCLRRVHLGPPPWASS